MIKTAFIGAGGISRAHTEAIAQMDNMSVTRVFDVNQESAERVAAATGASVCDTFQQALRGVDAVHILTPPSTHAEYAIEAMANGLDVFCEKPMTVTVQDGERIAEAVHKYGCKFMVAFNHRFRPGYKRLAEIARSGILGDVFSFFCYRLGGGAGLGTRYRLKDSWRTDPDFVCGMTVESLSHDINVMLSLTGPVQDVRAKVHGTIGELPQFDNNAHLIMTLKNGGTALIHASWASFVSVGKRGLIGTQGAVTMEGENMWDYSHICYKTEDMDHETVEIYPDTWYTPSYLAENQYFAECLEQDIKPFVNERDGLETAKISQAALKSHRENIVVEL